MRGVAAREEFSREQQALARLPTRDVLFGERVEIDAPASGEVEGEFRPVFETRRIETRRAAAVEREVRVARGGAVRQQRHRLRGCVRRVFVHLYIEHS